MAKASSTFNLSIPNRLAGLDNLRALAITMVFIFHYRLFQHPAWIDTICGFCWTGVDLFFVLSGYLISAQLFKQIAEENKIDTSTFFIKRFFRIIPAYLFIVAVYFCIPQFREKEPLAPLWKYLTFTQNLWLDRRDVSTFTHAWSLCVEEQFYLLLPFTLMFFAFFKPGKRSFIILVAFFALGFALRIFSWNHFIQPTLGTDTFGATWFKWMYYPTYTRLDSLLTGICVAGLCQFYPKAKRFIYKNGNIILMIGLAVTTGAYFLCMDNTSYAASIYGFPLVAVAYALLVASAISPVSVLYRLRSRVLSSIATLSYAIYLSHKGLIHLAHVYFPGTGVAEKGTLMFMLSVLLAIAGALIIRYAIEKPFLTIRDIVLKKRAGVRTVVVPLPVSSNQQ